MFALAVRILPSLLLASVPVCTSTSTGTSTYFIKPNEHTPCPEFPGVTLEHTECLTLQQYAGSVASNSTITHAILYLLPGIHTLSIPLKITNVEYFEMHRSGILEITKPSMILCTETAFMTFQSIQTLAVSGLSFVACETKVVSVSYADFADLQVEGTNGSAIIVDNSSFILNSSVLSDSRGSGLSVNSSVVILVGNNSFVHNADSGIVVLDSSLRLEGYNTFTDNTARNGGAVRALNSTITATGDNRFTSNSATHCGGVIYSINTQHSLNITGLVSFENNSALWGGAVCVTNFETLSMTGSIEFMGNTAYDGGAVHSTAYDSSVIVLKGTVTFVRNTAERDGGAIYTETEYLNLKGHSTFRDNVAHRYGGAIVARKIETSGNTKFFSNSVLHSGSSGGAIYMNPGFSITLRDNTAFYHNTKSGDKNTGSEGEIGGGAIFANNTSVNLIGRTLFFNNSASENGGAIWANNSGCNTSGVTLFVGNSANSFGGAVYVYSIVHVMEFRGVTEFNNNAAFAGGGMYARNSKIVAPNSTDIGVSFINNSAHVEGGAILLHLSSLEVHSNVLTLYNNSASIAGGGLYCLGGNITVKYNATLNIINNSAIQGGGGMYLSSQSYFFLSSSNEQGIVIANNSALAKGAAIFVQDDIDTCSAKSVPVTCFYQPLDRSGRTKYILFQNNVAGQAGNILYGGGIQNCLDTFCTLHTDFRQITRMEGNPSNTSDISSDPFKLCPCDKGGKDCHNNTIKKSAFPGETFTVLVVAVGQESGAVPSSVLATLENSSAALNPLQGTQKCNATCTNLTYTIFSSNNRENLSLTVDGKCSVIGLVLTVVVELRECPKGFQLSSKPYECTCAKRLQKYTKTCTIDDKKIHRTTNFWVGYDNKTDGLILHSHCPFDYCVPPPVNFTIADSDKQCNYNRTQILCGECKDGFSIALGSSRCLKCSNVYLSLIAVFALAGIALVFLLFTCRLTVDGGTLSGLIFFANVVHTNRSTFLPHGVYSYLIAWMNLDLGIETCFFNGMDTYAKTWLQFAFPIYVWVLCILIIILANRSNRFSRILGTNPVAVLATLFLLSYAKIIRTSIAALSFTTLEYKGHSEPVWLYDGNIRYLHGKHIPLFVVGFMSLVLSLPYTILLLTSERLRAWSNYRLLSWMDSPRVTFFVDVYNAPFKVKHSYWTGLLLILRLALLLIFATNVFSDPSINLLAITAASLGLAGWAWLVGTPYKLTFMNIIEVLSILNLGVFSVATLYIRQDHGNQLALAYTFTGLCTIMFIGILAYHGYSQIKHFRIWKTMCPNYFHREHNETIEESLTDVLHVDGALTTSSVTHTIVGLPRHTEQEEQHVTATGIDSHTNGEYEPIPSLMTSVPACWPQLQEEAHSELEGTGHEHSCHPRTTDDQQLLVPAKYKTQ